MFCNNCGRVIEDNSKFCGKCGAKIEESKVDNNIENLKVEVDSNNSEESSNQNYKDRTEQTAKKEAIASVVIPSIGIFAYIFVGLTVYIAALMATIGFRFAKGGKEYSKPLSIIGYVLNGILCAMALIMYIYFISEGK